MMHLESIAFTFWRQTFLETQLARLSNDMLAACKSTYLRELTLYNTQLSDFESLFAVLRRCHMTMDSVSLSKIIVHSEQNLWQAFFEILLSMPKLGFLSLEDLLVGRSRPTRSRVLDRCVCHNEGFHSLTIRPTGTSKVKTCLERIL
jgi:hypothetical protein